MHKSYTKNRLTVKYSLLIIFFFCLHASAQPDRKWATYYGERTTTVMDVAYDTVNHFVYMVGSTSDTSGIATAGSFQDSTYNYLGLPPSPEYWNWIDDIFLAKFDTMGNRIWATYFGGGLYDRFPSLTIDGFGHIYISGYTNDSSLATPGTMSHILGGDIYKAILVKFDAEGNRLWASYYGIGTYQIGTGMTYPIATDRQGNVYMSGSTDSDSGIATPGAYKESFTLTTPILSDGYLVKADSNGNRLWATYYGGNGYDWVYAVHTDAADNVYIGGMTTSDTGIATEVSDIDTVHEVTEDYNHGFLAKFSPSGERLWATYIGADANTYVVSITSDSWNNVYIYGFTESSIGIASPSCYQPEVDGYVSAFVIKYDSNGTKQWGTYYGTNLTLPSDIPGLQTPTPDIQYAPKQNMLYIGGYTMDSIGMGDDCTYPATHRVGNISKMDAANGFKVWSSYTDVKVYDLVLGSNDNLYMVGKTLHDGLASTGAFKEMKTADSFSGYLARYKDTLICPPLEIHIGYADSTLSLPDTFSQYTWYRNGTLIGMGSSLNNYHLSSLDTSGFIYAQVMNACGCLYRTDSFDLASFTGIVAPAYKQLAVYPNPSRNGIFHFPNIPNVHQATIRILDKTGRVLKEVRYELLLDLTTLSDGAYGYQVHVDDNLYSGILVIARQ